MFLQKIFSGIHATQPQGVDQNNHNNHDHRGENLRRNSSLNANLNSPNDSQNQQCHVGFQSLCLLSEEARLQRRVNQKIEEELRKEKRLARRNLKLLLLGTGESGKSTFIRQMKIIHEHGYETVLERREYVGRIHHNILITLLTIDHAMESLGIEYQDKGLPEDLHRILITICNYDYLTYWRHWFNNLNKEWDHQQQQSQHCKHGGYRLQSLQQYQLIAQMLVQRLSSDCLPILKRFWLDPGVQKCLQRKNEYNLMDSSPYYMERLDEIVSETYVPTVQDILHVRIPTNGINEYNFKIESVNFLIVDVGGQRTERRKWIHCFESVTSIIYIVALSEFDQILSEPIYEWGRSPSSSTMMGHKNPANLQIKSVNKLDESKTLFKTIITSRWFRDSSVLLFLNKYDLFIEKILTNPNRLQEFFPEFSNMMADFDDNHHHHNDPNAPNGGVTMNAENDFDDNRQQQLINSAADFILRMFYLQDPERFGEHVLYSHFTCATDTGNIKFVFQAVRDTIMQQMLCKEIQIF